MRMTAIGLVFAATAIVSPTPDIVSATGLSDKAEVSALLRSEAGKAVSLSVSGKFVVPTPCHGVTVEQDTESFTTRNIYRLKVRITEPQIGMYCPRLASEKPFTFTDDKLDTIYKRVEVVYPNGDHRMVVVHTTAE